MNDSSDKKKPSPPEEAPPDVAQTGLLGAVANFFGLSLPGGPPAPSQTARPAQTTKKLSAGKVVDMRQAQAMLGHLFKLTVDVANGMWRIRRRLQTDSESDGDNRFRGLARHIETTWAAFAQHGVEIKDHTGEKYVAGMAMSVVAYQATAGITFEKVIETVRPSIFFQDQLIQYGEVIVATPESMPEMDEPAATPEAKEPSAESAARPIPAPESSDSPAAESPAEAKSESTGAEGESPKKKE